MTTPSSKDRTAPQLPPWNGMGLHVIKMLTALSMVASCVQNSKVQTQSENALHGLIVRDTDSIPELSQKIRDAALAEIAQKWAQGDRGPLLVQTEPGKIPPTVAKAILMFLHEKTRNLEPVNLANRPCAVPHGSPRPYEIFYALQRAAVGTIRSTDKIPEKMVKIFEKKNWREILNYSPETRALNSIILGWFKEMESSDIDLDLTPTMRQALGMTKVDALVLPDMIGQTLRVNGIDSKDYVHELRCISADQVEVLPLEDPDRPASDGHRTRIWLSTLKDVRVFERLKALDHVDSLFTIQNKNNFDVFLRAYPDVESIAFLTDGQFARHIIPPSLSRALEGLNNRFKGIIVPIRPKDHVGSSVTYEEFFSKFPNLTHIGLSLRLDIYKEDSEGVKNLDSILQYIKNSNIKSLTLDIKEAKFVLPRLTTISDSIENVYFQTMPYVTGNTPGDCPARNLAQAVDVTQLARLFPKAKKIWIRRANVFMSDLNKLQTPIEWKTLDYSYCDYESKQTKISFPKEKFPNLHTKTQHKCDKQLVGINLSNVLYDPMKFARALEDSDLSPQSP